MKRKQVAVMHLSDMPETLGAWLLSAPALQWVAQKAEMMQREHITVNSSGLISYRSKYSTN